ncbi:MAG: NAD-dependent epimerase/dehydratase family protein [Deltaproteobacteria bacterium]|nr:NAD-dependent epimerase/dehydratase family protein [Deltaproteobacteria bacterium]
MGVSLDILAGQKVLLTGASGQLGGALARRLRTAGVMVHGLGRAAGGPAPWHTWPAPGALGRLLRDEGIDQVVHLASPIQLGADRGATAALEEGVLTRTREVGEACLDAGCALVHVGTCDEVAGGPAPFAEAAPSAPISAYAALKVAAAAHLRFLERAHGLRLTLTRPFRVVSPGEPRGLVAEACAAALRRLPLRLTRGDQRRQWCDPQGVAEGLARCLLLPAGPHPTLHLCPGEEAAVIDVVEAIFDLAGAPPDLILRGALAPRPGDATRLVGDDAEARALLGPLPARPLRALLAEALAEAEQRLQTGTSALPPPKTDPSNFGLSSTFDALGSGSLRIDGPSSARSDLRATGLQTTPSEIEQSPTESSVPNPPLALYPLDRHEDARGALLKALPHAITGEVYAVELRPGQPRGEHLHQAAGEWFCALSGAAWLLARAPGTGAEALVRLDGHQRAFVPAGVAHALWAADGQPALVLAGADRAHPFEQTAPFPLLAGRDWPDLPAVPR